MRTGSVGTVVAVMGLTLTSTVVAQTADSAGTRTQVRKWTVEWLTGTTRGFAAADVERAMVDAHLDGFRDAGCLFGMCAPATSYPETYSGGDVQVLMVGYRVLPALQIRALGAFAGYIGETTGLGDSPFSYVSVRTLSQSFAAIAALDAGGMLWLFAGASLDRVRLTSDLSDENTLVSTVVPGAWVGGQIRIPGNKRFFGSFTAMRHVAASATSEGFTKTNTLYDATYTVPAFSVQPNYTVLAIGFGVNF